MKNLKLIVLALAISISSVSFAATTNENPTNKLRQQIIEMLGKTTEKLADTKIEARIVFTVNNKNEIVIISVHSAHKGVENYVKSKLNRKKVELNYGDTDKIYHLPLVINTK